MVGGGGHAISVADSIFRGGEYDIAGYTDIKENNNVGIRYLGNDDVLPELFDEGIRYAFICTGFLGKGRLRDNLYEKVKKIGLEIPVIVDNSAVVSKNCVISEGSFVGKKAVINAGSKIGKMAIINTGAIVEHSCAVGEYSHIAVGAVLCGDVSVGNHTLVGAGATVLQGLTIGDDCIIGLGSSVFRDIPNKSMKVGMIT